MFSILHSGSDTERFYIWGLEISKNLSIMNEISYTKYTNFLGILYWIIGDQRLFSQFINLILGMWSIFVLYKILDLFNLKDSKKALAFTVDCNSRYVYADPETGCAIAVAEAARNITCSGGEPSAITNCLNFGNPYDPEAYWQFVGSIKGMSKACLKFETPVTGGNVSFLQSK